jgi:hypothetical protein
LAKPRIEQNLDRGNRCQSRLDSRFVWFEKNAHAAAFELGRQEDFCMSGRGNAGFNSNAAPQEQMGELHRAGFAEVDRSKVGQCRP